MEKNEISSYERFSHTEDTPEQTVGVYGMGNFVNLASISIYPEPLSLQNTTSNSYPQMDSLQNTQGEYLQ